MRAAAKELLDTLEKTHRLEPDGYAELLRDPDDETRRYAADMAVRLRKAVYGADIYIRGLIEFTNHCRNNCFYCGIRRDNAALPRYRLTLKEIHACCALGYRLGFRTFVLQGGEDPFFTDDRLCAIVAHIRKAFPDCAITLSAGERSRQSYQRLHDAGADRYLLRHETADSAHYGKLHPPELSWENRLRCLDFLKEIGYQTGCGFMVGSPGQTVDTLAMDLAYVQASNPDMCGIGPFLPHRATPFRDKAKGSLPLTLYLLSLLRLIKPNLLLPATTALGTLHPRGREMGLLAGANVVMPNLSPLRVRKLYELYDNKAGDEPAACLDGLAKSLRPAGYRIVADRGDIKSREVEKHELV